MIYFDVDLIGKTLTRNKALNYKSLVLSDGVTPACETDIQFSEDGKIYINKSEGEKPDSVEEDCVLIVKEFGLCKNIPTKMQIIFCDDYMLVDLIEGAIAVEMLGGIQVASRGMEKIPTFDKEAILWLGVDDCASYMVHWHKDGLDKKYTQDYLYCAEMEGNIATMSGMPSRNLTVRKMVDGGERVDPVDISGGRIAFLMERAADIKKTKEMVRAATAKQAGEAVSFADFEDDNSDEEVDDMIYGYSSEDDDEEDWG